MNNRIFDTVPFPGCGCMHREGLMMARCRMVVIALCVLLAAVFYAGIADAGPKVNRAGKLADRIISIDYGHHKLHDGDSFCVANTVTLASGAKALVLINTPDDIDVHLLISTRATAEGFMEIYEDTVVSALGTALEANNHNRQFPDDFLTEWTKTPTFTVVGTLLPGLTEHFGSGQTTGERLRGVRELVLKRDTLYLVNTISQAANNEVTSSWDYYLADKDAP